MIHAWMDRWINAQTSHRYYQHVTVLCSAINELLVSEMVIASTTSVESTVDQAAPVQSVRRVCDGLTNALQS